MGLLEKAMNACGICLSYDQKVKFTNYMESVIEFSEITNLTGLKREEDIIIKHFVDSVIILRYLDFENESIIDIGTGAGFPGIPLKIIKERIRMTLNDSSTKKISILKEIVKKTTINGVEFNDSPVERLGQDKNYREKFDYVITRAVAPLNILLEYGIPLIKTNGRMIVYKGPNVDREVENSQKALLELNCIFKEKHQFTLPFSDYQRSIIIVEKLGKTLNKYPRKIGIPRKRPL